MKLSTFFPLLTASWLALPIGAVSAQDSNGPSIAKPDTSGTPAAEPADATPSIQSSLGKYGDPGGLRAYLQSKGIVYHLSYIGEVLGNTSGGVKSGTTYEDIFDANVNVDFGTLAGLKGLTGRVSAYSIQGRGLSGNNVMNYFTVSSIEAYPGTLLHEAYLEQKFDDDKIAVRAGNLSADTEFFISDTASLLINSTFGWPTNLGTNLPSGGNAFPLGTPGVRVKVAPNDNLTLLAAAYDGDPAGPYIPGVNSVIKQLRDPGGVDFRVKDPPLVMTEAQYSYNKDKDSKGLPGTVKIGYLHHFEAFPSNDVPGVNLQGNDAIYGIIDQTIYRKPGTDDQGLTVFARGSAMPSDRNVFDFYFDAGFGYKGLIPGRDDDTLGLGFGYARISPDITTSDNVSNAAPLIRDYESLLEVSYQLTVVPGFTLQPDFQYVFHPGANGIANPQDGLPLRNSAVFGLRTTIVY